MKRHEKVKLWHNFRHETCNINMKYKCIHETKKIKYAIINVNYEKKKSALNTKYGKHEIQKASNVT